MSSPLDGIPHDGDLVGGRFVVERVLGVGGMGVVVAARHAQLGQRVAIKFLRRSAASSPEAVGRFLREARAVVGLQSAHVVRVMDVGTLDDGLPYMVMEHLSGTDLGHVLEVRTALPVEEGVDYVLQAIEAIAEAHAAGIVHRDLKPSNLFLTVRPDGSPLVKVLDFGISKAVVASGCEPVDLTATAIVLGTPLYMSPEQVRSTKNVDTRTDIWALGVILYELLGGTPPFDADSVTGLCAKIVADPPESLRLRRPEVPQALEDVIMLCLEKDLNRRPRSVAELAVALAPFATADGRMAAERTARIGGIARPSGAAFAPATPSVTPAAPPAVVHPAAGPASDGYAETVATDETVRDRRRRRAVAVASAAVALLAGVVLGGAGLRPAAPVISALPAAAPEAATAGGVREAPAGSARVELAPLARDPVSASASVPVSSVADAAALAAPVPSSRAASSRPAPSRALSRPPPPSPNAEDLLRDRK
ncbi:MAG: serine/threonine protein kinase [Polyangiaceae bacterium]|nr:serine/threonine protein kinase [Polyangiaceae bacterium]